MSSIFQNARRVKVGGNVINNHYDGSSSKSSIEKLGDHIAAGALHDSAERSDAPKCHPETRVAVQDDIVNWIIHGDSDDEPKKIMWVTGPAGSGKTAIMGSVADTSEGEDILAATFFFSSFSGSADRRSKRCLVPTLAYQLVQHKAMPQIAKHILSAVEHNPAIFKKKLEVQFDQLILEPLRACRGHPQLAEWPKVVLIDGLDECEADQYHDTARSNVPLRSKEDDQTEILSVLKNAASDPDFPFRLVIASRPEHAIRSFFTDVANSMTRELFLDEKYNPDADMALFLESKFANIRRRCHLPSSWPSKDVPETLITNASGQFIYVATVGRFMEGSNGDPDELLNQVLRLPGIQASTNPLAPLDALYTHILNSSPDPHLSILWLNLIFREKYLDTLRIDPEMTMPDLAPALFVRLFLESYPGQSWNVFRNLNSLVFVPPMADTRSKYRLYHRSLVDFLQTRSRSGNLYAGSKVVLDLLLDRYLNLWKSKGPDRFLAPQEKDTFFANFFSEDLVERVFPANNLSQLDTIILSCDVVWWVQSSLKMNYARGATFNSIFSNVHARCQWYTPCRPSCRHIRSGVITTLRAANWQIPSKPRLFLHKFLHFDDLEGWVGFKKGAWSRRPLV